MEDDISSASRLTYTAHTGRVTALDVCENSHSVASACDDGELHVWRVDTGPELSAFRGITRVRTVSPGEGPVTCVRHFEAGAQSLLVYATARGSLRGWDFRARRDAFCLTSDPRHGILNALATDASHCWVAGGTSAGVVSVWDLRFQTHVRSWRVPGRGGIARVAPVRGGDSLVPDAILVAGPLGNEASVWDIDSRLCTRVLRAGRRASAVNSNDDARVRCAAFAPLEPAAPFDFASRSARDALLFGATAATPESGTGRRTKDDASQQYAGESIRAVALCPGGGVLTGGTDRTVRLWDLENPADSYTVAGVPRTHGGPTGRSVFSCVTADEEGTDRDVPMYVITEEDPPDETDGGDDDDTTGGGNGGGGTNTTGGNPTKLASSSKSGAVPTHTDAILDMVVFTARHQRFLATAGRDGVVNVMS
jgi:phosphoinositide-3-kinase regulatory subunit 4